MDTYHKIKLYLVFDIPCLRHRIFLYLFHIKNNSFRMLNRPCSLLYVCVLFLLFIFYFRYNYLYTPTLSFVFVSRRQNLHPILMGIEEYTHTHTRACKQQTVYLRMMCVQWHLPKRSCDFASWFNHIRLCITKIFIYCSSNLKIFLFSCNLLLVSWGLQ